MKLGIIYKTTNIINGKWYIGKDETNRDSYLGSGLLNKSTVNDIAHRRTWRHI